MDTCSRMGVFEETCLAHIRSAVSVATGCTEPVAIALCAAAAREASTARRKRLRSVWTWGYTKTRSGSWSQVSISAVWYVRGDWALPLEKLPTG